MAKSFSERLDEIVKAAKASTKDGTVKSAFSRKFYDDVAGAVLNDPEYKFEEVKVRGGKPTKVVTTPSKNFREKMLTPLAKSFNLDETDTKKFVQDFKFSPGQAATIYDLMSAINWEYMNTGKILRIPAKEDFVGSIYLKEVGETTFKNPKTGKVTKSKKHRALGKRSSTPAWCKEK